MNMTNKFQSIGLILILVSGYNFYKKPVCLLYGSTPADEPFASMKIIMSLAIFFIATTTTMIFMRKKLNAYFGRCKR